MRETKNNRVGVETIKDTCSGRNNGVGDKVLGVETIIW